MFCGQCGKELPDGSKFCGHCGAVQGALDPVSGAEETERPKRKKGKGGLIAALVIVALLAAAGGGTALYLTGDPYNIAKDMKLAEDCLEEGEYREALSYYRDALRRDSTLAEAYLGVADVYLAQQDTEKAREELTKGLKKMRDEEAGAPLRAKLAEVYLQESRLLADSGDYAAARSLLQEGIGEVDEINAAYLTDEKAEIYLKEADRYLESEDLTEGIAGAMQILQQALEDGDTASRRQDLLQKEADVYRMESDRMLAMGECLAALDVLETGIQETGVSLLTERETYLRENIRCVRESGGDYQIEYDAYGHKVKETGRSDGGLDRKYTWEYDDAGRLTGETCVETYGIKMEIGYDENGIPVSGSYTGRMLGDVIREDAMEYDAASDRIKWTLTFRSNRDYVMCLEWIRPAGGEWVKAAEYDNQGYGLFSEYDAEGRLLKTTYSDSEGNVNIHEYTYDADGNRDWEKYYDNVGYGYETTMVYDASGNIIQFSRKDSNGDTESETYENEYDRMGSLIRCTTYNEGGNAVKTREIQYEYVYVGE